MSVMMLGRNISADEESWITSNPPVQRFWSMAHEFSGTPKTVTYGSSEVEIIWSLKAKDLLESLYHGPRLELLPKFE